MWLEDRENKNIKIVFYEDLSLNTSKTVKGILNFIGVSPSLARLDCLLRNKNQTFKRLKLGSDYSSQFSTSQQQLIARHVQMLNTSLVKNGHNPLPQSYLDFSMYASL